MLRAELNRLTADAQAALQVQRQDVNRQRDQLEQQRREIAKQRQRDPVIAAAIIQLGLILASLSPLLLAGYVLFAMGRCGDQEDQEVVRLLIDQVVTEDPPRFTSSQQAQALPSPDAPGANAATDERLLP